jgi:hypothetical protein
LAFAIAWEIANREEKLKVDKIWLTNNDCWLLIVDLDFLRTVSYFWSISLLSTLQFFATNARILFLIYFDTLCEFDFHGW